MWGCMLTNLLLARQIIRASSGTDLPLDL